MLRFLGGRLTRTPADLAWFREESGEEWPPKPTAPAARRQLRNCYLRAAFALAGLEIDDFRALWERFVTRGAYPNWREEEEPPDEATELERNLFHATKCARGETLTTKHLRAIVGNKSPS